MLRRLLWAFLRLVFFLPLWFLGLVVFSLGLVLSPWGTGLLLEEGAKRGFYELDNARGAPLDTLALENLRLTIGPARIAAQRLELAWGEDCLLRGRLCLDGLIVEGARIRLGESTEAAEEPEDEAASPLETISLPFPIEIRSIALLDVEVQLADGTRLSWEQFTTGAVAKGSTLTLLPTRLAGIQLKLPLSPGARLALSEADHEGSRLVAEAIDASIAVQSPLPAQAAAELEGLASLPLESQPRRELPEIRLPLRIEVPELLIENFSASGAVDYGVERLALSLSGEGHHIEVTPLEVTTRDADARLQARIEMRDDYPLEVRLEVALWLPEIMPELAGQRLDLALTGSLAELSGSLDLKGPVDATLDVRLDALDPTLPFSAALNSDLIQWPLPGATTLSEDNGDNQEGGENEQSEEVATEPWLAEDIALRLEGSLLDYRLAASLMVEGPQLPYTRLALTGTGDNQHFAWEPLAVSLGDASVVSHGRVGWSDDLAVEGLLRLDNVDPGDFVEGVQGRLEGDVNMAFAQSPAGWNLQIPELAIDGELQGLPLSLRAQVSGDSDMQWNIEQLDFRQAENRLNASGRVSESRLDVSGELNFPALANLHDQLTGSLVGDFNATGSLAAPALDLDLSGNNLAFADNRLERLRLDGSVTGLEDPELDVRLDIDQLAAAGQRFNDIALLLEGRLSNHRLDLDANAGGGMPLSRASLSLEGAMGADREGYAGRLSPLEVDTEYGEIRLDEPLAFELDIPAVSATIQPFCLRREQGGSLCLEQTLQASAEQGSVVLGISDLPLSLVEDLMPEDWDLGGATDAELSAEWRQGGAQWQANVDASSDILLAGLDAYGQPWQLPESRLSLEVDANSARADIDLSLALAESGRVQLTLGIDDPMEVGSLDGRLILDDLRLSRYRALVAGMETLEGRIDGDVRIGGDRQFPQLNGDLSLAGLRVVGGDVPLQVRDGELNLTLTGDRGEIRGFLEAEEGRLQIQGDAAWPEPDDWRIAIDMAAVESPLGIALPAFGRLRVAPDLTIRVSPTRLEVRGDVQVPWARLEIGESSPSAMTPSPDEIIITRRDDERAQQEAERARQESARAAQAQAQGDEGADATAAQALSEAGMVVDVQIDLRLGPDMQLEAYGLESGLSGTLQVRQQNGPVQLFGDVNLVDGRFQAFGQDLLIREGQLLFSGPPGQPLLNFEAIRNPEVTQDGVVAGLRVSGTAADPQLRVFSEPAMEEARALSYVLRGRPPEDGDSDGALTSALLGMSLGRTGGAVGAIGEAFGIDDLTVETAGAGDESQVQLSGQLTEDLRVSYGVGVFSPIAELTLRYTLWRNLYLEAVSGASQAVDLVYTFSLPGNPIIR